METRRVKRGLPKSSRTDPHFETKEVLSKYLIRPLTDLIVEYCLQDCFFVKAKDRRVLVLDSRVPLELKVFQDSFNLSMFGNTFVECEDEIDLSEWCIHKIEPLHKRQKQQLRVFHKEYHPECPKLDHVAMDWLRGGRN